MKRIFLTCLVAMSLLAAQAQTTKGVKKHKKSHATSQSKADAKAKAAMALKEQERQDNIEAQRVELLRSDSVRRDNDRMADSSFAQTQTMWKDSMNKQMDTTYTNRYKNISTQKEDWAKLERSRDEINKAAKLSEGQGRQVKNINMSYTDKVKMIKGDAALTEQQKKDQLVVLNTERLARIKAIIGNSKAKRLEKERKEYVLKNGADMEEGWIDEVEGVAKNN
ncbi:MAG: hypothetical protein ABJA37_11095 [Ferruginibacter sp.]